jgi:transposase
LKYTEQFKQKAVDRYLEGHKGYKLVAREFGIAAPMLRRWVLWYRTHGATGLATKTGQYSAEFKLTLLQYMWDNALSYTKVAAVFNLRSVQSVANWERRYRANGAQALEHARKSLPIVPHTSPTPAAPSPDDDKRTRDDLLKENERLRMEVAYLKKVDALLQAKKNSATRKKRKS